MVAGDQAPQTQVLPLLIFIVLQEALDIRVGLRLEIAVVG